MNTNYKRYCKNYQDIENFEKAKADNFKGWDCHHRLETHSINGERRLVDLTASELIALDMYYNRPATELIFIRHSEHIGLHWKGKSGAKGKHWKLSEVTKRKISEANKGHIVSEETRKRLSDALKVKTWTKGKPGTNKGKHWKIIDGKRIYY